MATAMTKVATAMIKIEASMTKTGTATATAIDSASNLAMATTAKAM